MSEMTQRQTEQQVVQQSPGGAVTRREQGPSLPMSVDIYEDDSSITLSADMPGVSNDRLHVEVSGDTLLLEGDLHVDVPANSRGLYADLPVTRYRRTFALSSELDTEHVEANLKNGVLILRLPKKEAYRPRRISVQTH
jgi:HSP20 family molecular chaperone IbpA